MKFYNCKFCKLLLAGILFSQTPVLFAVDESALPVIPDNAGKNFDPAKVDTIPGSGGGKTRAFGGSGKRLPPAPTTRSEIIRLMKKPKKTRAIGNKIPSPKARAYINFDVDSASIKSYSYQLLNEWGAALQSEELARAKIRVQGHTDNTGAANYNMDLSERRARTVAQYLASLGIAFSRFQIEPYGEDVPYASNSTESGRALNRRVEFVLDYNTSGYDTSGDDEGQSSQEQPYYE